MKNKFRNLPIQLKMTAITLMANLLVLAVNLVLLIGINGMSSRIDGVYQVNLQLNELSAMLDEVQINMEEYLNTKTSDSLETFYIYEQDFSQLADELSDDISSNTIKRTQRLIKNMSQLYLDKADQTIEAKRGRNVEKYRARYEETTKLYGYIKNMIDTLNNEQFKENSQNYRRVINAFRTFETAANFVMVIVILINALLILRLTASIIRPLKELKGLADEVSKGNFEIEPIKVRAMDEIGVVSTAFNQMVISIQEYIEKMRESAEIEKEHEAKELMMEAHLKDAQLKYLQAQINPHFLFNTLNAGAQLAMLEGADRTYEYVQVMAEFFRYNVKKGDQIVTIGEEIALIDKYIYILNVRFSGDINYVKEVDESLLKVEMPSMILQPIVENCVNHGIREMMGEGVITVKVFTQGGDIACISIEDNGAGMNEETVERLRKGKGTERTSKEFNGIGMDNVMARLKLFENSDDVMSIESEEGKGSRFTIYLDINEDIREE